MMSSPHSSSTSKPGAGGDTDQMPSDLFYACLDGPYDYNATASTASRMTALNGGDVDLIAEVAVGRACVGSTTEVDNFVGKSVAYLKGSGIRTGPVLNVGEFLWDPDTYGDAYMEELVNGSNHNGYLTIGIPESQYNTTRLYDTLWGYPPGWPASALISDVRFGCHHHQPSGAFKLRLQHADLLR